MDPIYLMPPCHIGYVFISGVSLVHVAEKLKIIMTVRPAINLTIFNCKLKMQPFVDRTYTDLK